MEPGTHLGLDFSEYKVLDAINKSSLDLIHRSPAHFRHAQEHPKEPTAALRVGSALHALVLEPQEFEKRYLVADHVSPDAKEAIRNSLGREAWEARHLRRPKFDRRTREGKEAAEAWERTHAERLSEGARVLAAEDYDLALAHLGKEVLSPQEHELIQGMAAAIAAHPIASALLRDEHEVTAVWEKRGLLCKARADALSHFRGLRLLVDVKTTDDASPKAFERSAWDYRYHVQAAWYLDGFSASAFPADRFVFIAVEKHPPHAVVVYAAEPEFIAAGRQEYEADFSTYETCLQEDSWPGYASQILSLNLPPWVRP